MRAFHGRRIECFSGNADGQGVLDEELTRYVLSSVVWNAVINKFVTDGEVVAIGHFHAIRNGLLTVTRQHLVRSQVPF